MAYFEEQRDNILWQGGGPQGRPLCQTSSVAFFSRGRRTAAAIVGVRRPDLSLFGTTRSYDLWMPFEMTPGSSRSDQCNQLARIAALRFKATQAYPQVIRPHIPGTVPMSIARAWAKPSTVSRKPKRARLPSCGLGMAPEKSELRVDWFAKRSAAEELRARRGDRSLVTLDPYCPR